MANKRLTLNVGDGLGFDQNNKLTVKYTGSNIYINSDGLYVEELSGSAGSVADNWSIIPGQGTSRSDPNVHTNDFIDINRDVSNLIFTYGLYVPGPYTSRTAHNIPYTTTVKSVADIVTEMNFPLDRHPENWSSFHPLSGELLQLVDGPTFRTIKDRDTGYSATEEGIRVSNNTQETKALFYIKNIQYNAQNIYYVSSMVLVCLYVDSTDAAITAKYTVGGEYSSNNP